ncbi:MAG: hypothetical protein OEM43_09255, partial [Gammaproteobacteria bacterium]|nr:hypothetical protein [Gammaproteobacteria bacterium]
MSFRRLGRLLLFAVFAGSVVSALLFAAFYIKIAPQLPSIEVLKDIQLQEPLRVYTRDRML